ncbi:MAG: transglutaminase-like domain-containing protein [Candidatus Obscuribacterales bacterium]|jgi:hypothetical protein
MLLKNNLIKNSNFSDNGAGWSFKHAIIHTNTDHVYTELIGLREQQEPYSSAITAIKNAPSNRLLNFSCDLKTAHYNFVVEINITALNECLEKIGEWHTQTLAIEHSWTTFHTSFPSPSDCSAISIEIKNGTTDSVFLSHPSLTVGSYSRTYSHQQCADIDRKQISVLETRCKIDVLTEPGMDSGNVTFAIPCQYKNQIPLCFELTTTPKSALSQYKVFPRDDGTNWLCSVELVDCEAVTIEWKSAVLVGEASADSSNLDSPLGYLEATKCVQSDDREILKIATDLAHEADSIEKIIESVVLFTASNPNSYEYESLDAKTALAQGGSCTSRANLATALLRALKIPARTVSHLPVWGSWMYQHWLVEYFHPSKGWQWIEPTMNLLKPCQNRLVLLAFASIDDENKSSDPDQLRAIMPGAPYLSGYILSESLTIGFRGSENFAYELGQIEGNSVELDSLFHEARMALVRASSPNSSGIGYKEAIAAAIASGSASGLAAAVLDA